MRFFQLKRQRAIEFFRRTCYNTNGKTDKKTEKETDKDRSGKEGCILASKGQILTLFGDFLKIGCFTFGGGWSIVAQMHSLYVEKRHTITGEELLDLASVAKSLPGVMITNVAMLYGHRAAGILGGFACVIGLAIPPMLILSAITFGYSMIESNPWVMAAMSGIRAAIVPIIISAAVNMIHGAFRFPPCYLIALLTFSLYLFWGVSCVWLVLIGVAAGLLISEFYERRGKGNAVH